MKAFRGTAVLFAFVLALAAYTAWEYKKSEGPQDSPEERKLFTFRNDQVTELKLTRGTETVLLKKDGEQWKMLQPVEDQAESSAVDSIIYTLMVQKGKIFRGEDDKKKIAWAEYGLEPPGTSVDVTFTVPGSSASKTETLAVSSKNAFDGSYYLRQGDDLLLGDRGMAQAVAKPAANLRMRRLWRERDVDFDSVEAEVNEDANKDHFSVKKSDGKWTLEPAAKFAVDSTRIDQWISAIEGLTPSEIASEALSEADKRSFLMLKPSLILRAQYKTKGDAKSQEWVLTVGQDRAGEVFLQTNQRPTVYKTKNSALAAIRVPRSYFREGKAAFKFPLEQVQTVSVEAADFKHAFKKEGSDWKLADPAGADSELHADKLANWLHSIAEFEAQDFPNGKEAKGFKTGQNLRMLDGQGKLLFELSWGDEYKSKAAYNKGMTFRFVKTNLEKDVMGVAASKIASLIDKTLVSKKQDGSVKKVDAKKVEKK